MDQAQVNASFTVTGKAETQQVLEKAIQQVVCTQDPITNYEVRQDRVRGQLLPAALSH